MKYIRQKEVFLAAILSIILLSAPSRAVGQEAEDAGDARRIMFPVASERLPIRTLQVFATAYSSDPYQTDATPCIPALGSFDLCENFFRTKTEDTIAANFLPLGAKVRFPNMYGDKIFVVRDRMNSRYNYDRIGYYRIDFYKAAMDDQGNLDQKAAKQEAIEFGFKRNIKMEVIGV